MAAPGPTVEAERRAEPAAPAGREQAGQAGRDAAMTMPPAAMPGKTSLGGLSVQAKSVVGAAGDRLEREADSIADRVMRTTESTSPSPAAPMREEQSAGLAVTPAGSGELRRQEDETPEEPAEPAGELGPSEPIRRMVSLAHPEILEGDEVSDTVQAYLDRSGGMGRPLTTEARTYFEAAFGCDLSDVRVHDDPAADAAARSIGAVAFTRGNDIYLTAGSYDPETEAGRRLLAHELTHVIQQTGQVRRLVSPGHSRPGARSSRDTHPGHVLRRATSKSKTGTKKPAVPLKDTYEDAKKTFLFDAKNRTLDIKTFTVPKAKIALLTPLPLTVRPKSTRTNQRQLYEPLWRAEAIKKVSPVIKEHVKKLGAQAKAPSPTGQVTPLAPGYYLRFKSDEHLNYLGSVEEISEGLWRPLWDAGGDVAPFQIDHKKDWMVGGENTIDNLRLLDAEANMSLGSLFGTRLSKLIDSIYTEAHPNIKPPRPQRNTFEEKFTVRVLALTEGGTPSGRPDRIWTLDDLGRDLKENKLVKWLKPIPAKRINELVGEPDRYAIFSNVYGGAFHDIELVGGKPAIGKAKWKRKGVFEVVEIRIPAPKINKNTGEVIGQLVVHPYKDKTYLTTRTVDLDILSMRSIRYGGYVSTKNAREQIRVASKKWSPIEVDELSFDVDKGFIGRARLLPTLPLLKGADIGLILDERGIGVNALISGGSLNFPGPVKVIGGVLELYGSLDELSMKGDVFFEIENLARGRLGAGAGTASGFALSGEIDFDTELFTKAQIGASYKDGKWGVKGELGIGPGKVAGIKSASVAVALMDDKVDAKGEFEPSIKGLKRGTLGFSYDPAKGMAIEGSLALERLPGVKSGEIKARVAERKDGQGWSLAGQVTAEPAIPGVTGAITGRYEDGAFLVDADLGYKRGLLDGRVHLGLTNQTVGTDGKPAGPPTDNLLMYGGGQATLRLAPWLAASASLEYKPNGQVVITGRIGLPQALPLFDNKPYDRNIFKIGLDVPIVGVAVLGQRIGIFATIQGGLNASAVIGPGQLKELGLEITYNPDSENETRVAGRAMFVVPAAAELSLFVQGGVGAGIPVVSATAGLQVSGALGLAGAATAGVDVAWTPGRGLILDTRGEIFVEPRFRFAVDAFVDVSAKAFGLSREIYSNKWSLKAFEFGSNLRFGIVFPVHYEEDKPFDLSLNQVQFVYPAIDADEILRNLVGKVVGR
ncbi:MAG TPA: DUF4157 domain-containing protein [Gemmataceae bacterium]|jgi:hypothetical protein